MLEARYARQMILQEIGALGQEKLRQSRVLIVGVGGLGSPAALYLAAAGVGTLGLIDGDQVDLSNLQRQILYSTAEIGQSKVDRALERLVALNPDVRCQVHREHLHALNALAIARDYDVIIDGTDNFAAKFLLNDVAVKLQKPLVYGSILRWEGQLAVFWAPHGPCYRCLFPSPPESHVPSCAEAGVVGALAGAIGSLQALETIKLLVGGAPPYERLTPLLGYLLVMRAATMETQRLKIQVNPSCSVCSKRPETIELVDGPGAACSAVDLELLEFEAQDLLAGDRWQGYQWIDVREREEWNGGHMPGAEHWPLSQLLRGEFPKAVQSERPLLLYCQAGVRSMRAYQVLKNKGWQLSGHLKDGFRKWQGPVEMPRDLH